MPQKFTILHDFPLHLDVETILAESRIRPESRDGKTLRGLIESLRPVMRPKAMYRVCYVQSRHDSTTVLDGVEFTGRLMQVNLQHTERVFSFIVTAGRELEEAATQVTQDILLQYALDVLKETVLRHALAYLQTHLKQTYDLENISMMNPGSLEDWPVTEQRALFSLFGDVRDLIGVELTESCLMSPVKSLSGVIFSTEGSFVNCELCPRENCPNRRMPYNEMLLTTKYRG